MSTRESYPFGGGGVELPTHREVPNDWREVNFPPVDLANAEGSVWLPGGTTAEMYHLWFYLNNRNAGVVNVTLGRDYGAGGALGAGEYWLNAEPVNGPGVYGWVGPFQVRGDDDVRGLDGGAGGNVVSCHLRIQRIW